MQQPSDLWVFGNRDSLCRRRTACKRALALNNAQRTTSASPGGKPRFIRSDQMILNRS
jgi:hypothetical protein